MISKLTLSRVGLAYTLEAGSRVVRLLTVLRYWFYLTMLTTVGCGVLHTFVVVWYVQYYDACSSYRECYYGTAREWSRN